MSVADTAPNGANPETANAAGAGADPNPNDPADPSVNINVRLLEESKRNKEAARQAKKELEELKREKQLQEEKRLADEGKYKDLYDSAQKELSETKSRLVEGKKRTAIERLAEKAGCVNVDTLLKIGNQDLVSYDPASDQIVGADTFLEEAKREHAYLFKQVAAPSVNPATPSSKGTGKLNYADWKNLPYAEKIKRQHEVVD